MPKIIKAFILIFSTIFISIPFGNNIDTLPITTLVEKYVETKTLFFNELSRSNLDQNDSLFINFYNKITYEIVPQMRMSKDLHDLDTLWFAENSEIKHPYRVKLSTFLGSHGYQFDGYGIGSREFHFKDSFLSHELKGKLNADLYDLIKLLEEDDSLNYNNSCGHTSSSLNGKRLEKWDKYLIKYPHTKHILTAKSRYSRYKSEFFPSLDENGIPLYRDAKNSDPLLTFKQYVKRNPKLPSSRDTKIFINNVTQNKHDDFYGDALYYVNKHIKPLHRENYDNNFLTTK